MSQFKPYGITLIGAKNDDPVLSLCEQLGIPFERRERLHEAVMPVVVIRFLHREDVLESFIARGGVIVTHQANLKLKGEMVKTTYGPRYSDESFFCFAQHRWGKGLVLIMDEDYLTLILDYQRDWHLIGYEQDALALVPCAGVSKGAIQRFWRELMLRAFRHLSLPLVHRWFFPDMARTHVNVRVDADWYDETQWKESLALLKPLGSSVSWFVTATDVHGQPGRINPLLNSGCEIGSHGFVHFTHRDYFNNAENIAKADASLRSLGVDVRSFVAPSAKWNPLLQRAVERAGYIYSSEFTFAYDCHPLRPIVDGRPSESLQIPVHPVSPGNFAKYSNATKIQVEQYFRAVLKKLYDSCLPVHLYGHPSDLPLFLSKTLFSEIMQWENAEVSTLSSYAEWWEKRSSLYELKYAVLDQGFKFISSFADRNIRLCCSTNSDSVFILAPENENYIPRDLGLCGLKCHHIDSHTDERRIFRKVNRRINFRSKVGEWLDYERITPAGDYIASSPRTMFNKVVKLLRQR